MSTGERVFGELVDAGLGDLKAKLEGDLFKALGGDGEQDMEASYSNPADMARAHEEGQMEMMKTAKKQAKAIIKYIDARIAMLED